MPLLSPLLSNATITTTPQGVCAGLNGGQGRGRTADLRFSGGADAQLSPSMLQGLAVRGCARLALAARVAVTVAVSDHRAGCRQCTPIMLPAHCATAPELDR